MQNNRKDNKAKTLEELVIEVKSVVKVTQGGRQRRFSATVVVGDRKGTVGIGIGKANEVPDAVKKAIQSANKNLIKVNLIDNRTIAHEVTGKSGACKVLIKPAPAGAGRPHLLADRSGAGAADLPVAQKIQKTVLSIKKIPVRMDRNLFLTYGSGARPPRPSHGAPRQPAFRCLPP